MLKPEDITVYRVLPKVGVLDYFAGFTHSDLVNRRHRRTAFEIDNGRSASTAGTALHAPYPTLAQLDR